MTVTGGHLKNIVMGQNTPLTTLFAGCLTNTERSSLLKAGWQLELKLPFPFLPAHMANMATMSIDFILLYFVCIVVTQQMK